MNFIKRIATAIKLNSHRNIILSYYIKHNLITDAKELKVFKEKYSYIYAFGEYVLKGNIKRIERYHKAMADNKELSSESIAELVILIDYMFNKIISDSNIVSDIEMIYVRHISNIWTMSYFQDTINGLDENGRFNFQEYLKVKDYRHQLYRDYVFGADRNENAQVVINIAGLHSTIPMPMPTDGRIIMIQGSLQPFWIMDTNNILDGYNICRNFIQGKL